MDGLQLGDWSQPLWSPHPVLYKRVLIHLSVRHSLCLSFQVSPALSLLPGPLASSTMKTNSKWDRPAAGVRGVSGKVKPGLQPSHGAGVEALPGQIDFPMAPILRRYPWHPEILVYWVL